MTDREILYAITNISLEISKMLKSPSPKIIVDREWCNNNKIIYCDYGVNEIHINETCLLNFDTKANELLIELFKAIYYNYEQSVCSNFQHLENPEVVALWKNELVKKLMYEDSEKLNLDVDISCTAFSYFIIKKFFNIDIGEIKNIDLQKKILFFENKYC